MFQETLRDIVERTEGSLAGVLMDHQGARIDGYARPDSGFDIDVVGVEYGVLLGSIRKATQQLDAGITQEVAIGTDEMITVIRTLGDQYYLALAMRPDGNVGKGRFLCRVAAPKLMAELA